MTTPTPSGLPQPQTVAEASWHSAVQDEADDSGLDVEIVESIFATLLPHFLRDKEEAGYVTLRLDDLIEGDSYGVWGSDFYRCRICHAESGAGVLNQGITHESGCPLKAAALSAPAVETVAVQEALKWCAAALQGLVLTRKLQREILTMEGQSKTLDQILDIADAALAPLPVAPKAEPAAFEAFVRSKGWRTDGYEHECLGMVRAGHLAGWIAALATPQADSAVAPKAEPEINSYDAACIYCWNNASAQPVGADTLTDAQIIAAARTAKAAHWNLTDEGCLLIGRAVLALASPPRAIPAEQAAPTEPTDEQIDGAFLATIATFPGQLSVAALPAIRAVVRTAFALAAHPNEAADRSAEADTARLDWLIEQGQDGCVVNEGPSSFWLRWIDEYDQKSTKFQDGEYPTARAAIDAAMGTPAAAEPGKGQP